jgi:signal peptidase I
LGAIAVALLCAGSGFGQTGQSKGGLRRWPVSGSAMEPTLHCPKSQGFGCQGQVGDIALSRRLRTGEPRRGDILVFEAPRALRLCGIGPILIKRVIGLAGEKLHEDQAGNIWINGKQLREPYVRAGHRLDDTPDFGHTWRVPKGGYFLIGDARDHSCDSRQWGSITRASISGKVVAIQRGSARITRP